MVFEGEAVDFLQFFKKNSCDIINSKLFVIVSLFVGKSSPRFSSPNNLSVLGTAPTHNCCLFFLLPKLLLLPEMSTRSHEQTVTIAFNRRKYEQNAKTSKMDGSSETHFCSVCQEDLFLLRLMGLHERIVVF